MTDEKHDTYVEGLKDGIQAERDGITSSVKELENDKFTLQEKYNICLNLKQFDRAKKYLLKIRELENE